MADHCICELVIPLGHLGPYCSSLPRLPFRVVFGISQKFDVGPGSVVVPGRTTNLVQRTGPQCKYVD